MPKYVTTPDAFRLLHEGSLALSEISSAGCRVDKGYLDATIDKVSADIRTAEADIRADPTYRLWQRLYGEKTNLAAPAQLSELVFKELGYKANPRVADPDATRESASERALEHIDLPIIKKYQRAQKLRRLHGTYLWGIRRELVQHDDGLWYVHPNYNLNTVITFRSCVAAGTPIEVVRDVSKFPKGVPIEDVRPGDYVYSYDDNLKLCLRKVLWAGKTGHRKVIRIHWSAGRGKKGHLDVTPEHKIRLTSGEYVEARALVPRKRGRKRHGRYAHVLAMGRKGHRIYETGNSEYFLDHRFVYSQLKGPLSCAEIIHHDDRNHLNNRPDNLVKMTDGAAHGREHASENFNDSVRRTGVRKRQENHRRYGDRWKSGEAHGGWISLTKLQVLRTLARCGGSVTEVRDSGFMDFNTFKGKAKKCGIDIRKVRQRYDASGRYISRGRMVAASGLKVGKIAKLFNLSYYRVIELYDERGIELPTRPGAKVNNHWITRIEEINRETDVYDLEVEGTNNFIAGEICVHNSCNSPNWQNVYKRDPEFMLLVRRCYVPRPGFQITEHDYGQIEVRTPCCYNFDPVLMNYVTDPTTDMHRDTAMELYFLTAEQVKRVKAVRHLAKNKLVFPTFYGSYYAQCAPPLWEGLEGLTLDGKSLYEHLAANGITELGDCDGKSAPRPGSFEAHVKKVEESFWNERFTVYAQWKRDWYQAYLRDGGFMMLSGFAVNAPLNRKQACNSPIQGTSFHFTLWSLIRLVRRLKRYKMRSRVIGEIHDAIQGDTHPRERQDVIEMTVSIMTEEIKQWAPWLNVPLVVEPEACPVDGPWSELTALKAADDGTWVPPDLAAWEQKHGIGSWV